MYIRIPDEYMIVFILYKYIMIWIWAILDSNWIYSPGFLLPSVLVLNFGFNLWAWFMNSRSSLTFSSESFLWLDFMLQFESHLPFKWYLWQITKFSSFLIVFTKDVIVVIFIYSLAVVVIIIFIRFEFLGTSLIVRIWIWMISIVSIFPVLKDCL